MSSTDLAAQRRREDYKIRVNLCFGGGVWELGGGRGEKCPKTFFLGKFYGNNILTLLQII